MNHLAIVDDDFVLLNFLKELFEAKGLHVSAFEDPVQALPAIKEIEPDVVLADVLMPEMNGFDFCRALRSDKAFTRTPIFLMSAKHSIGELSKSMMAGADDYFIKPFQTDDIYTQMLQTYTKKNNPIVIKPSDG
ncbi:response regulator [Paenibacillus aceris]|uniref:DNA-binding response OmpR family regulator n=1 Tax=Paenibacillus aceris TaxID=869555 RepID=A0ABS4ICD3_9BACL|nr:response regulator transcription factor [Paenibacillus aceris]MBP1967719.1 DNA-binding response OmpR family regulator [Paenibacillus aceris]NHW39106.1 response regulator [Paenibacillus aceris]